MNKHILAYVFVFLSLVLSAQKEVENNYYKTEVCKSFFPKVKLQGENNVQSVENFLRQNISNLKDSRVGLKLNYVNKSPGGFHYSFAQTFNGVDVYQSEIKVNVDRRGIVRSVFDNSENTFGWQVDVANANATSVIALHASSHLPVLAKKILDENSTETLTANGEIIFRHSLRSYLSQDSLVSGKVFMPDPLTSSQNIYGAPYYDNNDSTNASLNAELHTVSFKAKFTDSIFSLENDFVKIVDFEAPNFAPATSTTPQFYFNRSQSGFEDVNAFYHINVIQQYIHSLGFNAADGFVEVDAHAVAGADQSYFTPSPPQIRFGTGGVDDAEDADVCVHEYGHAIAHTAAPFSNVGSQRNALDEAFGDYLAGTYSKTISTFNQYWVFNWDGHNQFWNGRVLNTCRVYPDSLVSSFHRNGEIWASALYAIHEDIGRGATDSLILEAHYSFAQNISMADAALLLLDADSVLMNGAYHSFVHARLQQWGFVAGGSPNACFPVGIKNAGNDLNIDFSQDGISFRVNNLNGEKLRMNILNMNGQLVAQENLLQFFFDYRNENLSAGIYLVMLQSENSFKTFKWCKTQ